MKTDKEKLRFYRKMYWFMLIMIIILGIITASYKYMLIKEKLKNKACGKLLTFSITELNYSINKLNMSFEEFSEEFLRYKIEKIIHGED